MVAVSHAGSLCVNRYGLTERFLHSPLKFFKSFFFSSFFFLYLYFYLSLAENLWNTQPVIMVLASRPFAPFDFCRSQRRTLLLFFYHKLIRMQTREH